ncbi:Hsp20/alpha crystallin family protein [Aquisalimonas asiatica]|uniref:HSP20 family protein n=1 Tax=Aquisalimonas asiatica TaxID=406100 RepID=A0A1H8TAL2_9GAMM|nr:Hsp20/alpha crystallin family protein [Aquisalimonas asiatica]SEO87932.1 HSP20 family protein [Aquisalimonas asiatica]
MFGDLARFDVPVFNELSRALRLMDETFGDFGSSDLRSAPRGAFPYVNVGETDEAVNVYVFAPGMNKDDLELTIENNTLFIHGQRKADDEAQGRTYYRRERFTGEFSRAVRLPEGIDADKVQAQMQDGVLSVRLEKAAEQRPRRIEIQAA